MILDKIDIKDNKDLLEYISILEEIYIPDFDNNADRIDIQIIRQSDNPEEFDNICNQSVSFEAETLMTFVYRYNNNLLTKHFNYDGYTNNKKIQEFIQKLELDKDKFWMLILFVFDYSYNYYLNGKDIGESPNEQLLKFVNRIVDNAKSFNEEKGTTFFKPMTLKICIDGERDIIIDNPTAIHYIADSTYKQMKQDDLGQIPIMNHKRDLDTSTSTKDSPFIAFFAQMFLNLFSSLPFIVSKRKKGANYSFNETDLVCQLIAFTRISKKACWLKTENETLKSFLKQYKDFEPSTINSIYPRFRM